MYSKGQWLRVEAYEIPDDRSDEGWIELDILDLALATWPPMGEQMAEWG